MLKKHILLVGAQSFGALELFEFARRRVQDVRDGGQIEFGVVITRAFALTRKNELNLEIFANEQAANSILFSGKSGQSAPISLTSLRLVAWGQVASVHLVGSRAQFLFLREFLAFLDVQIPLIFTLFDDGGDGFVEFESEVFAALGAVAYKFGAFEKLLGEDYAQFVAGVAGGVARAGGAGAPNSNLPILRIESDFIFSLSRINKIIFRLDNAEIFGSDFSVKSTTAAPVAAKPAAMPAATPAPANPAPAPVPAKPAATQIVLVSTTFSPPPKNLNAEIKKLWQKGYLKQRIAKLKRSIIKRLAFFKKH